MSSMFKTLSRGINGPRAMLALVGVLFLMSGVAHAADTDIIITEIMNNPDADWDQYGEWFEIHNTGPDPVDLEGWVIKDVDYDSTMIVTGGTVIVPAGGYAVLCANDSTMNFRGVTALYEYDYSNCNLGNGADEIILLNASMVEVHRVEYDGGTDWPDLTGASMYWDETTADNNVGTDWHESTTIFGGGDKGTPGEANPVLQSPLVDDVIHRALLPVPAEAVTVSATITDSDGTIASATLYVQVNGGGFNGSAMALGTGDVYTGTITGGSLGDVVDYYVSATDNDAQTTTNPGDAPTGFYSYTVANEVITPIASIQADPASYDGTLVMVQGQVYIPGDYKADGTSVSAYIQDGSGRGLNIYGTNFSTGGNLLNDTSAIVKVSGRVDQYYSTVEIINYEVETISTGNPELTPSVQSTVLAAAPTNEGTYTQSTGTITAIATTGPPQLTYNFTVDDGSGPLVLRIDDDLVAGMETWLVGETLGAAGAGATYSSQGQIIVGLGSKVIKGADTTPPLLLGAVLSTATTVTLTFNEALDPVTASNAANYQVYQTASPGVSIAVTGAVHTGSGVVLTLAASAAGLSHTVQVDNVKDVAGNTIAAGTTRVIFQPAGSGDILITEVMQNPTALSDGDGEWFEVYNAGSSTLDMNGWVIKDAGFDSTVINNGGPLIINPGEYKVFVRNAVAMAAEGVAVFYEYTGITLGNGDDELILTQAEVIINSIAWDGGPVWPDPAGMSMQWMGTGSNNDGSTWAANGPAFGSGDLGTPGAVNDWLSPVPIASLKTALDPNYPNPFNPRTTFSFSLDKSERVTLAVYDVRGLKVSTVVDSVLPAGRYEKQFSWDGMDSRGIPANSGTYFYRLTTASGFSQSGKMTLLK